MGLLATHSRPYVSNDNPYSESAMKYPQFPSRFGSAEDGLFCCGFRPALGNRPYDTGDVHYGRAEQLTTARRQILLEAAR